MTKTSEPSRPGGQSRKPWLHKFSAFQGKLGFWAIAIGVVAVVSVSVLPGPEEGASEPSREEQVEAYVRLGMAIESGIWDDEIAWFLDHPEERSAMLVACESLPEPGTPGFTDECAQAALARQEQGRRRRGCSAIRQIRESGGVSFASPDSFGGCEEFWEDAE